MFYFLSKTIFYVLMPFTWMLVALVYALFTKNAKRKKYALGTGLLVLLFFNNSLLVNKLLIWWEPVPIPYASISQKYDVGIVLTGVTIQRLPNDRVFFAKGADRATHALQLYRLGLIKKILITGGKPGVVAYGVAEADKLKEFFLMAGVPKSDLLIENEAKNTYENAQYTVTMLRKNPEYKSFILITSAFHMRRAAGCFSKAGLAFDTFPVDYYSHESRWEDLIPSASMQAFQLWSLLIHEWIGVVTYRLTGKSE